MKIRTITYAALSVCILLTSCVKEKLENIYNKQEDKIDQFIEKNRYQKRTENGETVTDTLRVIYNSGSSRLVTKEGEGEELKENGAIAFYYAGYIFSNGISNSNLFTTNHKETAVSSGWTLTDEQLLPGLKSGLAGVRAGEECQIFFSGKYGFGKKSSGIVPANSALVYKIWVESISNE